MPCSVLGEWLVRGRPRRFATPAQQQALLLAALNRNLLAALALDLAISPSNFGSPGATGKSGRLPSTETIRAKCANLERRTVWARDIVLPQRTGSLALLAQTYALLARLPIAWAENVVAWAPPIVSPGKRDLWLVCGNPASAWIAHARLLDAKVAARMAGPRFRPPIETLTRVHPLVCTALPRFLAICEGLKQEIADFSNGVFSGQWENQLRRAMTYRYRQRARNEREATRSYAEGTRTREAQPGWICPDVAGTAMALGAPGSAAPSDDDKNADAEE